MTEAPKSVWTLTRTTTASNGTILLQHVLLFNELSNAKDEFCNIIKSMEADYDHDRDHLELEPRRASLYYENGGTDYAVLDQITIL